MPYTCDRCPLVLPCWQDRALELRRCAFCPAEIVTVRDSPSWWHINQHTFAMNHRPVTEYFNCHGDMTGVVQYLSQYKANAPLVAKGVIAQPREDKLICAQCRVRLGYAPAEYVMFVIDPDDAHAVR